MKNHPLFLAALILCLNLASCDALQGRYPDSKVSSTGEASSTKADQMASYCPTVDASHDVLWTYEAGEPISGAPAFNQGQMVLGTYDGGTHVFSLNVKDGSLLWSKDLFPYSVESSPAIGKDGTVYVNTLLNTGGTMSSTSMTGLTVDGFSWSKLQGLIALSKEDGSVLWASDSGTGADGSPVISPDGSTVFNSNVYNIKMLTRNSNLDLATPYTTAYDAGTGEVLWRVANNGWTFSSGAITSDGATLFVGSENYLEGTRSEAAWGYEGQLKAIDVATGETLWTYDGDAEFDRGPILFNSSTGDLRVLAGNQAGDIILFDEDGTVLAEKDFQAMGFGTPVVGPDYIYVTFGNATGSDKTYINTLVALDKQSLDVAWTYKFSNAELTPAVGQNALYGISSDGELFALDLKTGAELWTKDLEEDVYYGYVQLNCGLAITASKDGTVYAVEVGDAYNKNSDWPSYRGVGEKATGVARKWSGH